MSGLSPEAWGVIGLAVTNLGAIAASYAKGRAERQQTDRKVEEVRELAAPTGNGYAARTTAALDRIERKVDGLGRDVLHHLQDHSRSDLERRDPGEKS